MYRTHHHHHHFFTFGAPVKQVTHAKSLGVHIDQNLSWNMHIKELAKKIASGIGALKRVRQFVPVSVLHTIFNSLVQPHFNYCCVVWDNCGKTLATKLQKLVLTCAFILTYMFISLKKILPTSLLHPHVH